MTGKKQEIEIEPGAWERFERAVDVVAKSPPQHKTKGKPKASRKRRAKQTKGADR
jgi:hypothetical protein